MKLKTFKQLNQEQRVKIYHLYENKTPIRKIAKIIGVHHTTFFSIVVNNHERIGDFEIDTIHSKSHNGGLFTGNDRRSRYTLIHKINNLESNTILGTMLYCFHGLKVCTITSDDILFLNDLIF